MTFKDLNLIEPLMRAITEKGYDTPTPIQEQAIPPALEGRDLMGCAQTGTGKTAAFMLPIMQQLLATPRPGKRPVRALVLTPTRELAIQIEECCHDYACHTDLKHTVIFGGVNQRPQVDALKRGVDILIATPGRLLDLIGQGCLSLADIRFFVLDEADRMLDMGFIHDIRRILPLLPRQRQTLFFSATMPSDIVSLSASMLQDPVHISVTPQASVVETISQSVYFVEKSDKKDKLIELLRERPGESTLVFSRTKHGADRIARILAKADIEARAIHGDKSQSARERAMNDFRSGACRVLIATDIAARGIDISELPLVINYDLPEVPETYVHRIGRTGRAGCTGTAISFCSDDERPLLKDIQKLTGLLFAPGATRDSGELTTGGVQEEVESKQGRPAAKQNNRRGSSRQPRERRQEAPKSESRKAAPKPQANNSGEAAATDRKPTGDRRAGAPRSGEQRQQGQPGRKSGAQSGAQSSTERPRTEGESSGRRRSRNRRPGDKSRDGQSRDGQSRNAQQATSQPAEAKPKKKSSWWPF